MLRFQSKPDAVFSEIVTRSLEEVIEKLDEDLKYRDGDGWVTCYFENEIIKAFGGDKKGISLIKKTLEKLLTAHKSDEIFMPSDYLFKLLDRVLNDWATCYSGMAPDWVDDKDLEIQKAVLRCKGRPILNIEPGSLIDTFFWDTDYDFDSDTAKAMAQNEIKKEGFDVSSSAIRASLALPPNSDDLALHKNMAAPEKWDEVKSWFWFPDEMDESGCHTDSPSPIDY